MLAARLGAWLRHTWERWAKAAFAEKLAVLLALGAVLYTIVTGAAELRYQARAREALAQVKAARLAASAVSAQCYSAGQTFADQTSADGFADGIAEEIRTLGSLPGTVTLLQIDENGYTVRRLLYQENGMAAIYDADTGYRVFRAERPQKGRLREFVQCDIDILGDESPNAEVELIDVTTRALLRIGFKDFTVNINDRRILRAMLEKMGFAADQLDSVCISFDKLDKIGADGVKKELLEKEFDAAAVEALDEFLRAGDFSLDAVTARVGDETLTADLRYVIATAEKIANGRYGIAYAPSLVRGQGYYTGMVFEVTCPQFSGAVAGGGRYDKMVGKFIGQQVPAVGFSIGFERVCGILLEQDYQIPGAKQKLALLYLKDADFAAVLAKADALRAAYDVTVLPQAKKLGKQFGTLEAAGYNAIAFADNDDIKVLGQKAE